MAQLTQAEKASIIQPITVGYPDKLYLAFLANQIDRTYDIRLERMGTKSLYSIRQSSYRQKTGHGRNFRIHVSLHQIHRQEQHSRSAIGGKSPASTISSTSLSAEVVVWRSRGFM
jgi:hypothetical protein